MGSRIPPPGKRSLVVSVFFALLGLAIAFVFVSVAMSPPWERQSGVMVGVIVFLLGASHVREVGGELMPPKEREAFRVAGEWLAVAGPYHL